MLSRSLLVKVLLARIRLPPRDFFLYLGKSRQIRAIRRAAIELIERIMLGLGEHRHTLHTVVPREKDIPKELRNASRVYKSI